MWDKYLGIIGWEIDVIVICVELKIKYSKKILYLKYIEIKLVK